MILLDTHIWIWWIQGDPRLKEDRVNWMDEQEEQGLGISILINIFTDLIVVNYIPIPYDYTKAE